MWREKIKRYRGRRLSQEQVAIATVLVQAISHYSEASFCAGWLIDIEHELWEQISARKPDAYERAVKKLHSAAKKPIIVWGKPSAEFLAGLRILARRHQVWVSYQKEETAIHLKDWLVLHKQWRERQTQQRPGLEEVWQWIHRPFPLTKSKTPVEIPTMPKLN